MEKKSWVCTVIIQLALCFALYCAINMGDPQTPRIETRHQHNEIYFISVRGGFRPLKQQTHLLKQFVIVLSSQFLILLDLLLNMFKRVISSWVAVSVSTLLVEHLHFVADNFCFNILDLTSVVMKIEKVIYAYNVGFVINISELGEDDLLLQNATQYFNSLKVPWYTTMALKEDGLDYFFKQFNISSGRTFAVIALNTRKIQDSASGIEEFELNQLSRKLDLSSSIWHIAATFHPLLCNQSLQQTQAKGNNFLYQMLMKHGVDAYLSGRSCDNEARIGGPYFTTSQGSYPPKEVVNMFLLHRVSSLEITTYGVGFKGDIIRTSTVRQRGREAM